MGRIIWTCKKMEVIPKRNDDGHDTEKISRRWGMSIYRRAEKEIDILERDLETETDPIERKRIEREIRDIERDVGNYQRLEEQREAQNE